MFVPHSLARISTRRVKNAISSPFQWNELCIRLLLATRNDAIVNIELFRTQTKLLATFKVKTKTANVRNDKPGVERTVPLVDRSGEQMELVRCCSIGVRSGRSYWQ